MRNPTLLSRQAARFSVAVLFAVHLVGVGASPSDDRRQSDPIIVLGALLFNDTDLSADGRISCAECHQSAHAFSDSKPRAQGVHRMEGTRNAPTLLNAAEHSSLFWDGRRGSLEELMLDPILGPREHGLGSTRELENRVTANRILRKAYADAYGERESVESKHIARALAEYVGTLRTSKSAFDRYAFDNDSSALNSVEASGYELFKGRAGCTACHLIGATKAPLSDEQFHNQGVGSAYLQSKVRDVIDRALAIKPDALSSAIQSDSEVAALGRFLVSRDPNDIGAFRTPSLRNVSRTSPYMHDGSVETLQDAVQHELYYSSADRGANFSYEEREALVAFLRTLTDEDAPREQPNVRNAFPAK
jgi:cytochrome c peroxidase